MKAILVIDMPKDCRECPCFYDWICCQAKSGLNVEGDEIPRGCPLKPMPEKMKVNYDFIASCEVTEKVVAMGWNACIDEILGGNV